MNKKLFKQADIDTKKLIKDEAEKSINALHYIDDALTTKTSNLYKVILSVLFISSGYCLTASKINSIYIFSIAISILLISTSIYIQFILRPKPMAIIGADPKSFMKEKYLKSDKNNDFVRILDNRCISLGHAFDTNIEIIKKKSENYKTIEKTLLIGTVSCIVLAITFHLIHLFLCIQ